MRFLVLQLIYFNCQKLLENSRSILGEERFLEIANLPATTRGVVG